MIDKDKISIVIPVYNEDSTVARVVSEILEKYGDSEVIVVDDGSTDNTGNILGDFNIRLIRHETNKGYGASLKTGIKAATNDVIITIDSDGEHSVDDVEMLILNMGSFDMVVGKRSKMPKDVLWKMIGKYVLRVVAGLSSGVKIPDINSGLRIFRKRVIGGYFEFFPDSFSFHTTSTLAFIFNNHKIKYFPIATKPRYRDSRVPFSAGIDSLKKIFALLSAFRPQRIPVLMGYPLLAGACIFFLINYFVWPLAISLFLVVVVAIIDIFTRCDRGLITMVKEQNNA